MLLTIWRGTRAQSVLQVGAVALVCMATPTHAFSQELGVGRFGSVTPLSDAAFEKRMGTGPAAPRVAAPSVSSMTHDDAVRSDANVFSYQDEPITVKPPRDLTADSGVAAVAKMATAGIGDATAKVRPDLLAGMPEGVARLIVKAAREEGVDPNLMLSIARAENGAFDPNAVSRAGAVGLVQMLPETGAAFGAEDLMDPAQNVRASAKFLRVLVDKYANPVLVAAAYNAGEPRVDVGTSLPLIRETADYVTRVVGLYTSAYEPGDIAAVGKSRAAAGMNRQRKMASRGGSRARSSMLVFSANEPVLEGVDAQGQAQDPWGAVKIRKEGSL
jgi:Transglycosylase SLT domain